MVFGTGIRVFSLKEVELLHKSNEKPHIILIWYSINIIDSLGFTFNISISHTK